MLIYFGLLLVFVFEYMRPGSYIPMPGILNSLLPLGIFGLSIVTASKHSNEEILRERNTKWILYFLFLIGMSILITAEVRHNALTRFNQVLGYAFMYFMVVKLTTDLKRLSFLFATLVLIHVGLVVLNPAVVLNPETRNYIQGVTFLGDGNDFALSIVITMPMCLFLILESKSLIIRLAFILAMAVLILAVVGTSSRGATIALALVMFYIWSKSRKKMLGVAALIVVVIGILSYAPSLYFERMQSVQNYEEESSAKGRLDAWAAGIRMAKDNPLRGVGAGHFGMMYSNKYRPADYDGDSMRWLTAHSIYFLTLGELGLPGLLFLIVMIPGSLLLNSRRLREVELLPEDTRETERRLLVTINSSIIGFGVGGAFLSAIYYPHIYIVSGIMAVIGLLHREQLARLPVSVSEDTKLESVPLSEPSEKQSP